MLYPNPSTFHLVFDGCLNFVHFLRHSSLLLIIFFISDLNSIAHKIVTTKSYIQHFP